MPAVDLTNGMPQSYGGMTPIPTATQPLTQGMPQPSAPQDQFSQIMNSPMAQAAMKAKNDEIKARSAVDDRYMSSLKSLGRPAPVQLEKLPEPIDQSFQDPLKTFSQFGPALAMLIGARSRQPLMGAMNAASSAMNAFHKNDAERLKLELNNYSEKLKKVIEDNKQLMEMHKSLRDDQELDMSKLAAIYAADGNKAGLGSLNDPAHAFEYASSVMKGLDELEKTKAETQKYLAEARKADSMAGQGGGKKYLESIIADPSSTEDDRQNALKKLGQIATSEKEGSIRGAQAMLISQYTKDHPNATSQDLENFVNKIKEEGSESTKLGGKAIQVKLASNVLDTSLPSLIEAAKKLDMSNSTSINDLYNSARRQFNDKDFANFSAQLRAATGDYAQLIGRGNGTVHSDEEALKLLNESKNTNYLLGFQEAVQTEQKNLREGISKTEDELLKNPKQSAPKDVDPALWDHMTPEEQALFK